MLERRVHYTISCDYPGCGDPNSLSAIRSTSRNECERGALAAGWIRGSDKTWYCPRCAAKLYSQTIAAVPEEGSGVPSWPM
jgi:hypothetical protein